MLRPRHYSCPFCASAGRYYVTAYGDELQKCSKCELVFLVPYPNQEEMIRRHQTREYAEHPYFRAGEKAAKQEGIRCHQLLLDKLRTQLPRGARVLDVGSGSGDVLELLSRDFQVTGIEPSPYLAERIRNRADCPLFVGAFEDYLPTELFDAVLLIDVIEHAADPRLLLHKARSVLKPGGLLFVTTIDSSSLLYRMTPFIHKFSGLLKLARYVLHRIYCYQHNWYFNQRVLRDLIATSDFEVIEQQGFEFPLNRLREKRFLVAGLRAVYFLQSLLGPKTEQYLQGRKHGIGR